MQVLKQSPLASILETPPQGRGGSLMTALLPAHEMVGQLFLKTIVCCGVDISWFDIKGLSHQFSK
jgi:hypothetical protein